MLSRRETLQFAIATGLAGALGGTAHATRRRSAADSVTRFSVPLTVPPVLRPSRVSETTDYYSLRMSKTQLEIIPGTTTEVLTYGGEFPGATIKALSGRPVVIDQVNDLDMPTSVHLHGGSVPADSDGSPMDTIAPGEGRTYTYPNEQGNATLWTHDHAHHMEAEHVYRGLAGLYLLTDESEGSLSLPSGDYEVPLVLRDAHFDENAQLVYTMGDVGNRTTILVNGSPWPRLEVAARKYRFRILNASNLRFFNLCLSDDGELIQIGSDGGLLERPYSTNALLLSPGERVDVVIDFSRYPAGTQLVLRNSSGPGPVEQVGEVMRFDVGDSVPDPSSVPAEFRALPALPEPTVERDFVLRMDNETAGTADSVGYINDKVYDSARIDTTITWGSTEVWTVTNANRDIPHNFHLHLVQFRMLERDGRSPDPGEAGLKDTVAIAPGETVKFQVTFDSYRGVYPYHCHMIDHSAMGMMAQMEII